MAALNSFSYSSPLNDVEQDRLAEGWKVMGRNIKLITDMHTPMQMTPHWLVHDNTGHRFCALLAILPDALFDERKDHISRQLTDEWPLLCISDADHDSHKASCTSCR